MARKITDVPTFAAAHSPKLNTVDTENGTVDRWRVRVRERLRGGRLVTHATIPLDGVRSEAELVETIEDGIAGLLDEHSLRLEMVKHGASSATAPTGFLIRADPDGDAEPEQGIADLLGDGGKDGALVALVDGYYRMALSFKDDNVKLRELLFRREGEHQEAIITLALREGERAALEGREEDLQADREKAQFWATASALLPHLGQMLGHAQAQARTQEQAAPPDAPPTLASRWSEAWGRLFVAGGELGELYALDPELLTTPQREQLRYLVDRIGSMLNEDRP